MTDSASPLPQILDPRSIVVAIPAHDGRIMIETTAGLIYSSRLFAGFLPMPECSDVSLVRAMIADAFLRSPAEWLVCIDSDIGFLERDFRALIEPTDPAADYGEPPATPEPTRIHSNVFEIEGAGRPLRACGPRPADVLVCAEYRYKVDEYQTIRLGLGFTRIHRSVFRTLQHLKHEDGAQRIQQMSRGGRLLDNFYPTGSLISELVPTAEWKGEDHGFFTLCMLAGITPRIERRTRLVHLGRKGYAYTGEEDEIHQ